MAIRGILFDKDGTLIDFYEVWGTAAQAVMQRLLIRYGWQNEPGTERRLWAALGVDGQGKILPEGGLAYKSYAEIAEDLVAAVGSFPETLQSAELAEVLRKEFYEEVSRKRSTYPTFTDLPALMRKLCDIQIHVGVATTDEAEPTRLCMDRLGIAPYISFYAVAGGRLPIKPSGELIRLAAAEWNIRPEEIAVVGDTPNDMWFAHNGKALGIGVLSGVSGRGDLADEADYLIPSVDALLPLVNRINGADIEESLQEAG